MNIIEIVEFITVSGLVFLGLGLVNHFGLLGLLSPKTDLPPAISEGGRSKKIRKK